MARIASATVTRLLNKDHVFALRMLRETARRLQSSMLEVTQTAAPVRERLIAFLLDELASSKRRNGTATITLPAVKRVVASRLGTTGETLSRVFRELSRENLVAIDGLRISVPDVGKLRAAYEVNQPCGRAPRRQ